MNLTGIAQNILACTALNCISAESVENMLVVWSDKDWYFLGKLYTLMWV